MNKTFEPIRAPARVMQIIREIAISPNGLTLARLVGLTNLPKTSVLSLLRSLEASNYVDNVAGTYKLGQQAVLLSQVIHAKERFLPAVRPALRSLYDSVGETVQICVLSSDEPAAESVEVIETQKPIRLSFPVGLRRPLYCSAVGKLLLAFQDDAWTAEYLKTTPLTAYTKHTITDPSALKTELRKIKSQGWCVSHQGMFEDSSGIAAVIMERGSQVRGAVSLVGPTYRVQRDQESLKIAVIAAAVTISEVLNKN